MATTVTLKPNAIDISGSTSGTTTLQATAVAGTTTITLPAATDTLVGKATTDTLTNKTLTTPVISTISNTGTLTLPTSTDTLVGRATTDTLTNKTLTTPVISSLSSASATALTLQSAGTTAITVDTSQNVNIGTTGYGALFSGIKAISLGEGSQIYASASGGDPYTTVTSNAFLNSGAAYKYVVTDFASRYEQYNGTHTWHTAASGTAGNTITFTQSLAVGKGTTLALEGATSASGTGIAFPATQSASSDANTLDDYEEGTYTMTWTPGSGSITLSSNTAKYTKVGRLVTVNAFVSVSSVSSPSGTLTINLPFTSGERGSACLCFNSLGSGGNISTTWSVVESATTSCIVYIGGGQSVSTNFSAYVQANSDARITITYIV